MQVSNNISVGIAGTGVCIPERTLTNQEMEQRVDTSDQWIKTRTGIKERRIAEAEEKTSDLAVKAAKDAIENAGITADEIDLIIVATASPDYMFPSTGCLVQERLGASKAAAFDLSAGCSGFVYGLVTGAQFILSGLYSRVLVIGAEKISEALDWNDRNTCVLFGDAAGAVVLTETKPGFGLISSSLGSDGSGADILTLGYKRHITMNGREVFKFAVKIMEEITLEVLNKAGLETSEVDCFIPHQANVRIIDNAAKRLGLPKEKVFVNVDRYGNTSAASIPVALHEAREGGRINKGDNVVLLGFGAGLTWAAAVLKWNL